ncbi:efflux RND transporter periplasmic adaptor subunit [Niastella caeni]|uniref:Efflux RND transporter periplasmic adaptor subunit n=1 Tax=Niastella caeni TaxID=2569763 RepID=A0A4S8HA98_9BACT|nr:efflux RND transporter periplasmic adaptor subunit [Niastella caeni]THU31545.1 efflux RND transporter periplasmic adaptor subunit [Niastella caeni]
MKKKIIQIAGAVLVAGSIGVVLASNKAKIDKAAQPVKDNAVIPVKIADVIRDSFNTAFTINGTTSSAKEVKIASEVQGKLVGLYIKNGDVVRKGQVIAQLDAGVYHAQLASVESSLAKALLDINRYTHLIEMGGATSMQLESVKLQHASLLAQKKEVLQQIAHMQILSPFNGKVENVSVETGSFVSFGTVLAQLIDNSSLKINVYLGEQEAFKVKAGQPVVVNSVVITQPQSAHISMISDKADAAGKFLTEISLPNNGKEKLKAGILADVTFSTGIAETGLSIPVSALLAGTKQATVYVVNANKVQHRTIKTGLVTPGKVQVLEGLQEGEQVVVSGQLNLENGMVVKGSK